MLAYPRMVALDAHRVFPALWQGSRPPVGSALQRCGVQALVLAAEEYQPAANLFPGVRVQHAPLDDHMQPLTTSEWQTVLDAATFAAHHARRGRRTLVTCQAGINRSGIITAMALCLLTDLSGRDAVRMVRQRRPGALRNQSFADHIESVMR